MPPTASPLPSQSSAPRRKSGREMNIPDLLDRNGCAVCVHTDHDAFDVAQGLDVTHALDHVFGLAVFDDATAHVIVGIADGGDGLGQRNVVGEQLVGIYVHLVFADESTDAGDFGHARRVLQVVTKIPILKRAQIGQAVLAGLVHQRVFIDPTHAGGVRPQRRTDARRQVAHRLIEIFQHAGTRPIHVRAVLKDDIHKREAEERLAAHVFDVGRGRQAR